MKGQLGTTNQKSNIMGGKRSYSKRLAKRTLIRAIRQECGQVEIRMRTQEGTQQTRATKLAEKAEETIPFLNDQIVKIKSFLDKTSEETVATVALNRMESYILKAKTIRNTAKEVIERMEAGTISAETAEEKLDYAEVQMAGLCETTAVLYVLTYGHEE